MATAYKNLKVCALILMIFLSLGFAFYLFFLIQNSLPLQEKNSQQPYELLSLEEARLSYEEQVKNAIQTMLDSWFGPQKTKVSVRAQIDFTQTSKTKEALDVDNPALSKAIGDNVEYTYSKQTISDSKKSGQVKQLSVAVLIDNKRLSLSESKRNDLRRLIERTAGFNLSRGDSLEIIETSFASVPFFSSSVWSHSLSVFTIILLFVLFGVIMTKNAVKAEQIGSPPSVLPTFTQPNAYISSKTEDINGEIEPNALNKAKILVQNKPNETMTLLRTWLYQTEAKHE